MIVIKIPKKPIIKNPTVLRAFIALAGCLFLGLAAFWVFQIIHGTAPRRSLGAGLVMAVIFVPVGFGLIRKALSKSE